ncbi:hypothetical protein BBOR36S_02038 [Brevibacillus borstelensis]
MNAKKQSLSTGKRLLFCLGMCNRSELPVFNKKNFIDLQGLIANNRRESEN